MMATSIPQSSSVSLGTGSGTGGYERTNSMTSFSSFASSAMDPHGPTPRVPRGSSTNDLLNVESMFTRPSRGAKNPLKQSASTASLTAAGQRYNSMSSNAPKPVPRANSLQQDLHANSFRGSASLTNIPSYRRQSIENAHLHQIKAQYHQQQKVHQSKQMIPHGAPQKHERPRPEQYHIQPSQKPHLSSRRNQHMPKVPFTFPNGEVYIPRDRQRSSHTNLKQLNTELSGPFTAPSSIHSNSNPSSTPQSPTKSIHSLPQRPYTAKPHINVYGPQEDTPSPTVPNPALLSASNFTSTSFSSSPSPSRASRTNSSVNESTPPSSIDDLTIQTSNVTETKSTTDMPYPSGNLQKIDEQTDVDSIAHSAPSVAPIVPATASVETKKERKQEAKPVRPAAVSRPMSHQPVPQQVKAKASFQSLKSHANTVKTQASSTVERKPSALKRFFSKVFRSKKTKRSSMSSSSTPVTKQAPVFASFGSSSSSSVSSSRTNLSSPPSSTTPSTGPPAPKVAQHHPLQRETSVNSDMFSFCEGDEDALNVKLTVPDFDSDEHKNELALDSLFSKLSANNSREDLIAKAAAATTAAKDEVGDEKTVDHTAADKKEDAGDKPLDEEDTVISFDDMEFIEKIIEFGETSFPDLSATDLGQSQRKLMRSKSIERRKSIRSVSSSSKMSNGHPLHSHQPLEQRFHVVYSNQPKVPLPHLISARPSILKRNTSQEKSQKKVGFTKEIYVNNTYPSYIYNRHSVAVSGYQLSPQLIQDIRRELNEFKRSMVVHEASLCNTHFFRA